jgi:hypothetical protein
MITSTSAQKLNCGGNYQIVFKIGATVKNVGKGPASCGDEVGNSCSPQKILAATMAKRIALTVPKRRTASANCLGMLMSRSASAHSAVPAANAGTLAAGPAAVPDISTASAIRSGRNFSAWIGLVPKQHSSGGKDRLGTISKQGDRYLRGLFVAGALALAPLPTLHSLSFLISSHLNARQLNVKKSSVRMSLRSPKAAAVPLNDRSTDG